LLGRLKMKMQAAVSNPIQAPSDSRGFRFLGPWGSPRQPFT
jgi:hypothetical protein